MILCIIPHLFGQNNISFNLYMNKQIIIGKIYADRCGYCQILKPEWNKLKMETQNKNIKFVEIEQGQHNKMVKFQKQYPNLEVNGYPTIFKIYPNKQIEYYTGDRIAKDMKKWAKITPKNMRKTFRINNNKARTMKKQRFFGLF